VNSTDWNDSGVTHRVWSCEVLREDLRTILQQKFPDEDIVIDYVPKGKPGDYYTNLAFRIASREGKDPMQVAEKIAGEIRSPILKDVAAHQPAFVNFTLKEEYLCANLLKETDIDIGQGKSILIEFVSANPTGPINVVSARAAAVGDSLRKMLQKTGFKAHSEYYINDAGRQIDLLAESVRQRMIEIEGGNAQIPENGYHGEYVKDVAKEMLARGIDKHDDIKEQSVEYFVKDHRKVMDDFGVHFDFWTHESTIYKSGYVDRVMDVLRSKNLVYNEDGATFFKAREFGDNKDRVIVTTDNRNTYLLPDIAYHLQKLERKYNQLVDIWGPDHHGRIKGIQGGIEALGYRPDMLKVLIVQEVKLKKDGKSLTMSKRAGTFETLSDLLESIPKDVVRFFFLMRSSSQHLDFDLDLALKQSEENPVYYVQYAYARIMSIIRHARESKIEPTDAVDLSLIREEEELQLVKDILRFPEKLEDAVRSLEPYMVTYYMIDMAHDFHYFYQRHRVVSDDKKLTQARLYLIAKTAATIRNGLDVLGVSCPEKM
jgi:arginyl-tRNA synthetase